MNNYDESYYQEVEVLLMDQQLSDIERALERVEEVEELIKENVHKNHDASSFESR